MDKKKLIYILTGIMGVMLAVIVVVAISSSISNKKLSFDKVEDKMVVAAEKYFRDNSNSLPQAESGTVTVDASTLVNDGYLEQLSDMVEKGADCTGKVVVSKNGNRYLYSPILNCGEKYQTKKLVDVVISSNPIVTTGDGLYSHGDVSKFKGEYVNNYVEIDEYLWRILDIDSDGYMRLIYVDKTMKETYVWDDRYNITEDKNVGVNDYTVSRIKETIKGLENGEQYVSESSKANLAYRPICIGKRSVENLEMNIDEECETTVSDQLFGLPYVTDYVSASIDANCKDIDDESCVNYNYLTNSSLSSWTLNGQKERSSRVFAVSIAGYSVSTASNKKALRPTVYLSNNSLFASGTGTKEDPYIIK